MWMPCTHLALTLARSLLEASRSSTIQYILEGLYIHQYGWSGSARPFLRELQKKTWNPKFPCAGYILRWLMLCVFYCAAHAAEYSHCSTWPLQIWYLCAALCRCYDPIYMSYPCWYYVVLMKLTLSVSMSDWATTGREEFVMNSAFLVIPSMLCIVQWYTSFHQKNQLYKTLWFNITSQTSFWQVHSQ